MGNTIKLAFKKTKNKKTLKHPVETKYTVARFKFLDLKTAGFHADFENLFEIYNL